MRALLAAAENAKGSKANEMELNERASRIFFVSGEPGSGKSTLYLTLKAMLGSKDNDTYGDGYADQDGLAKLRAAVRLLDPLDLEVAGQEGENLLAAVLVRLFGALDESSTILSKECENAIKDLEELATDIGIAWEGNLQARAGALDPETYSGEVMRTQRARLGVNKRLKEALDKLALDRCCGCAKETLFVLPVDDFYLKPDASLQLLRLLRMISIPRLFFLVMGDITTVEALFIEKSLADWTAVAGPSLFPHDSDRLDQALTRARELRARYLRKLLPPGQRATIDAMDWYEALDFEVGSHAAGAARFEVLEKLLEEVKLDSEFPDLRPSSESLLAFLISPPFTEPEKQERRARAAKDNKKRESEDEKEIRKDRAAYTALQILDATPREMMDLGFALQELIKKQKVRIDDLFTVDDDAPLLVSCIRDFVELVQDEQSFLSPDAQGILEGVLPTRHYSPEDISFRMDFLSLQPDPWPWNNLGLLWFRKHKSWNLSINPKFLPQKTQEGEGKESDDSSQAAETRQLLIGQTDVTIDPFAKLPPRPAAWFILLHDLALKWKPDSIAGNLVETLRNALKKPVRTNPLSLTNSTASSTDSRAGKPDSSTESSAENEKPPHYSQGWAVWRDGPMDRHFPLPNFKSVRDIDRFLRIWNAALDWFHRLTKQSDQATKGTSSQEWLGTLIGLWGVAGEMNDSQYSERRPASWFTTQLTNLKERISAAPEDESWLGEIKKLLRETNLEILILNEGQAQTEDAGQEQPENRS